MMDMAGHRDLTQEELKKLSSHADECLISLGEMIRGIRKNMKSTNEKKRARHIMLAMNIIKSVNDIIGNKHDV